LRFFIVCAALACVALNCSRNLRFGPKMTLVRTSSAFGIMCGSPTYRGFRHHQWFLLTFESRVLWSGQSPSVKLGVMHGYKSWWGPYKRALEKRAIERPVRWVGATVVFSFVAGVNTICALFGGRSLPHFGVALVIYATVTSCIVVGPFGFTLVRVLRQEKDRTNTPTAP
jgi:hypothetical protein